MKLPFFAIDLTVHMRQATSVAEHLRLQHKLSSFQLIFLVFDRLEFSPTVWGVCRENRTVISPSPDPLTHPTPLFRTDTLSLIGDSSEAKHASLNQQNRQNGDFECRASRSRGNRSCTEVYFTRPKRYQIATRSSRGIEQTSEYV